MKQSVYDLLMWAAGSPRPLPALDQADEDMLLEAASFHKLTQRLAHRLNQEQPVWYRPSLQQALTDSQSQTLAQLDKHLRAIREIIEAMSANGKHVIMIKGFSVFALTDDQANIHFSRDLDLLSDDADHLKQVLLQLGYIEKGDPAPHEFANMVRGDILVDIHSYYPILVFANMEAAFNLVPDQHPGCWVQTPEVPGTRLEKIQYQDLAAHSLTSTLGIWVPDPTMCALILCGNAFKDAEMQGIVQLGDMADLYEMTRHPLFDQREFLALADRFGAHCALEFVSRFLEASIGYDILPTRSRHFYPGATARLASPSIRFPWHLVGNTWFCAAIDMPLAELLVWDRTIKALVEQLGANTIITPLNQPKLCSVSEAGPGEPLDRVIVQDCQSRRWAFQFAVTWTDQALVFEFSMPATPAGCYDTIAIDLLYCKYRCIARYSENRVKLLWNSVGDALLDGDDRGCNLRLSFPWAELPLLHTSSAASLPILMIIERKTSKEKEMCAATLIPLNLVPHK